MITSPVEHFVDAVVLLVRGNRPVLDVIVEAQLRRDDRKLYTWPQYAMKLALITSAHFS